MSWPNLATAKAVLNWAWTVRHPIKGTIKCGPQYDDVAAYLAECVRLRECLRDVDIVFDGPPSHESGRFVEAETIDGRSVCVGDWIERPNGHWALRLSVAMKAGDE